jgi:hypothetical protein
MVGSLTTSLTMLAAEGGGSNSMLQVGLLMLGVTVILGTINMQRRRKARTPGMSDYVREHAAKMRQKQGVQEDLEQIVLQINELARHLNAQMDTRFAKLEQVIAEADEKIATLEGLLRQATGVKGVDVVIDDRPAADETTPASETTTAGGKSRKTGKKPARPEKPAAKSESPPNKVSETSAKDPAASVDPDTLRYGRLYSLADQGLPIVEIARQTGQTTGEIELILNLRKSRAR